MASKDKGGRNVKKTATRSLKEKRLDKKTKGKNSGSGDPVSRI